MLVCALGDLLLDVVARTGPDTATSAQERSAETHVGAGGQAANVSAWARELGAEARFVGKRASDAGAELVTRELAARGVDVCGPIVEGRNGVVVSLVAPDGARTMLSDRGVAPGLHASELELAWFRGVSWLHLAGYSLFRSPIDEAAAKAAGAVQAQGGRVSVDLSSAAAIEAFGPDRLRGRLTALTPHVVFANEDEAAALGAPPPRTFVLKRGAAGIVVRLDDEETSYPAEPAEVVDTTGAGDALAAGFLVGGPELGLRAAARCVSKLGAMP
ncbi:MAG: carbohydrate kinase family protein [Gaiellaceae bacterium]